MQCPSCGASNVEYAATCSACGRLLRRSARADRGPRRRPGDGRSRLTAWLVAIGSLAAVALIAHAARIVMPAYRDYAIRMQVAEGLALAEPFQRIVRSEWQSRRAFAELHSDSIVPALARRGAYVDDVAIASGAVVITFGGDAQPQLSARTLTLVPALDVTGNRMEWQCGRGAAPAGFESIFDEPSRLTDVPDDHLPEHCRRP